MDFCGMRIMIAGEGVSGKGAREALTAAGAECFYASEGLRPADLVVMSPGIPDSAPEAVYARERGIPVTGELEIGAKINTAPIYAVTGTNGKTTTVCLLNSILKKKYATALCGNVGASFAQAASRGGYDLAVVEASSFQLETIDTFRPRAAAILNIAPDHLDRYPTAQAYARAKLRIAENMAGDDLLILNADDIPLTYLEGFKPRCAVAYVSCRERVCGAYLAGDTLYLYDRPYCKRDRLKLNGDHNVSNALTALLMADFAGAEKETAVEVLGAFGGVEHRIEYVRSVSGRAFYNDSKGTNIAATVCACRTFGGSVCLIAGGSDKGLDYGELFEALPANIVRVVVTGETAEKMLAAAQRAGYKNTVEADSLETAVRIAARTECECVLLSPAAASFDRFTDYTARGRAFVQAVEALDA